MSTVKEEKITEIDQYLSGCAADDDPRAEVVYAAASRLRACDDAKFWAANSSYSGFTILSWVVRGKVNV